MPHAYVLQTTSQHSDYKGWANSYTFLFFEHVLMLLQKHGRQRTYRKIISKQYIYQRRISQTKTPITNKSPNKPPQTNMPDSGFTTTVGSICKVSVLTC